MDRTPQHTGTKLFMIINEDRFFLSHRKEIAIEARRHGFDVTVVAKDCGRFDEIRALGVSVKELPINPLGMNPKEELKTLRFLYKLYRGEHPDIVHHVGLKNILWGGLAAKFAKVPGVVNAVSGLGSLFNGGRLTMMTRAILTVMRFSNSRKGVKLIFQNTEDRDIFLRQRTVKPSQIEFTKGSGINLNEYAYVPEPESDVVNIIFTGRMVREKGVSDLIDAAKILEPEMRGKVKFLLCGRVTSNKNAITQEYLDANCDGEYICYLGERADVHQLLEKSHIMAFPSYYREGVPKSLIEASAIGRAMVTCDSTGCHDVVTDGVNGLLVEPQNPQMLADKLRILINNPELRREMGLNARKKAEKEFSIRPVLDTHIKIYKELSK